MKHNKAPLDNACASFLHDVLLLREGDSLLVYVDKAPGDEVARDIQSYAQSAGIDTDIFQLGGFSDLDEMIAALCDEIAEGNYDAVCELSYQYFYPTRVWGQAVQRGCRVYALGPIDRSAFVRCIGEVNHERLAEFGETLYQVVRRARRVRLETASGTRISFRMNTSSLVGRVLAKMRLTRMSQVWKPTGGLTPDGGATFLGGQLSFLGIPDSINGTAVIDAYMWPPDELGHLVQPIVLEIERGEVVRFSGDPEKSERLEEWLGGRDRKIQHFCIGFNPGAQISSNLVEAERAYGHITIGLGRYPFHTDGVIRHPKLLINGSVVMENHSFVHKDLSDLAGTLRRTDSRL